MHQAAVHTTFMNMMPKQQTSLHTTIMIMLPLEIHDRLMHPDSVHKRILIVLPKPNHDLFLIQFSLHKPIMNLFASKANHDMFMRNSLAAYN